jgi:hypothetical protein
VQGCQIFLVKTYLKREKFTKLPQNLPNSHKIHKIYQVAVKYTKNVHKLYQHLPLQDPPKFIQIWGFGLKVNHLATLTRCCVSPCAHVPLHPLEEGQDAVGGRQPLVGSRLGQEMTHDPEIQDQ